MSWLGDNTSTSSSAALVASVQKRKTLSSPTSVSSSSCHPHKAMDTDAAAVGQLTPSSQSPRTEPQLKTVARPKLTPSELAAILFPEDDSDASQSRSDATPQAAATVGTTPSNIDYQKVKTRDEFLSDSDGRLTTQPIPLATTDSDLPPDALVLSSVNASKPIRKARDDWMKAHGHKDGRGSKTFAKALAKEILRGMEARKRDMVGIDRGGCTLVNEARRSTFVQNPGVRRVVEKDY